MRTLHTFAFMARSGARMALLMLFLAGPTLAESRMALFLPDDTPFWNRVALFAQAAADDLDVELQVFDADANRLKLQSQLKTIAAEPERFDALLFPNFLQTAERFLEQCQALEIPCILFNSDLAERLKAPDSLHRPRSTNPFWIGQLIPDDRGSSEAITRELIERGREHDMGSPLVVAAVNGYQSDAPAIKREQGLRAVIEESRDVTLKQVFYTDWGANQAYIRTQGLLRRYQDTDIIWSANYRTTNGILRALRRAGQTPGQDVLVNSYDINPQALEQVEQGSVAVTAGGHYVEGAWAVILAYDYLQGQDFQDQGVVFNTPLLLVTRENVDRIRTVLNRIEERPETLFRVDFARYSRSANPNLETYHFSLKAVLRQYQSEWALAP